MHQHGPGAYAPVGEHFIVQWWTSGSGRAHEIHAALVIKTTDVTLKTSMSRTQTTMLVHEEGPIVEYQRVIWDLRSSVLGYAEIFQRYTGLTGPKRILLPTLPGWAERLKKCDDLVATLGWAFPGAIPIGGSPAHGAFALFAVGDLRPFIKTVPGNPPGHDDSTQIAYGIEIGQTGSRTFPPMRSPLHVARLSFSDAGPRQQQDRLHALREFFRVNGGLLAKVCSEP